MADDDKKPHWPITPLYAGAMRASIASGDLDAMKEMVGRAEKWLQDCGDVSGALEVLEVAIAKAGKAS